MKHVARVVVTLPFDVEPTDEVVDALNDLAAIMLVQAEDGLFVGGYPESESGKFLTDFGPATVAVEVTASEGAPDA